MFRVGSKICWKWAGRPIEGHVRDVFRESVTRTIKGAKITRHGTPSNPAYLVESVSGNLALKLGTELSKPGAPAAASGARAKPAAKSKRPKPSMFGD